jgi:hypothetical protein
MTNTPATTNPNQQVPQVPVQEPNNVPSNPAPPGNPPNEDLTRYFQDQFGVTLEDAQSKYNDAILKVSLGEAWDVSPQTAMERLTEVMGYIEKLPPEEQDKFNSIDGVLSVYDSLQQPKPAPSTVKPFNFAAPEPTKVKSLTDFTRKDIAMNVAEYQAAIFAELQREGAI